MKARQSESERQRSRPRAMSNGAVHQRGLLDRIGVLEKRLSTVSDGKWEPDATPAAMAAVWTPAVTILMFRERIQCGRHGTALLMMGDFDEMDGSPTPKCCGWRYLAHRDKCSVQPLEIVPHFPVRCMS